MDNGIMPQQQSVVPGFVQDCLDRIDQAAAKSPLDRAGHVEVQKAFSILVPELHKIYGEVTRLRAEAQRQPSLAQVDARVVDEVLAEPTKKR